MHQKLTPDPFLILVNNTKQRLHGRNSFINQMFWKRIIKKFYKRWLYFSFEDELHVIGMSIACHSYVTRMYSYVSSVCHWYVLVCHPYVTRMYSYVIRMTLVGGFTMNRCRYSRFYMMIFSSFQKIDKNLNLDPCILNFLVLGTTSPAAYWLSKQQKWSWNRSSLS